MPTRVGLGLQAARWHPSSALSPRRCDRHADAGGGDVFTVASGDDVFTVLIQIAKAGSRSDPIVRHPQLPEIRFDPCDIADQPREPPASERAR